MSNRRVLSEITLTTVLEIYPRNGRTVKVSLDTTYFRQNWDRSLSFYDVFVPLLLKLLQVKHIHMYICIPL